MICIEQDGVVGPLESTFTYYIGERQKETLEINVQNNI